MAHAEVPRGNDLLAFFNMTDGVGNIDETGNFGGDWIGVLPNNFINNSCYLLGRQRANFSLHNFYGESGLTFANFPDQFTYSTMIYVDEPLKTTAPYTFGIFGAYGVRGLSDSGTYSFGVTPSSSPSNPVTISKDITSYSGWTHFAGTWKKGTNMSLWINGVKIDTSDVSDQSIVDNAIEMPIAALYYVTTGTIPANTYMYGCMGNFGIWNRSLDDIEIGALNVTQGYTTITYDIISNFSMTAINSVTTNAITDFNATVNGTLYNSIGGQINTTVLSNSTSLYDITFTSIGYSTKLYANYNVSSNLEGSLTPYSITFINQTPANNTQYNDVLWREFDLNIDFSGDDFVSTTCDIMANDVIKQSITHTGNGTINYNSLDHPFTGTTYYNWTCYNDYTTLQTPTYVFYTDLVFPNLQTNFKNNTLVFENNLTGQFNFTDDQILYGWNISIDGSEVASNFTLGGTTNTSFDLNTATTALSVGDHTLNVWFADGHTANIISDQKVSDGIFGDSLKFTLNKKWVKIENEVVDYSDRMTATKEKDRYTWEYTPAKVKNKYTFKVSASDNIKIVEAPDTPYKRWLIVDNRWMDFYTEDGYVDVSFKRISDKEVRVTLDFPKTKDVIKFKSIGELNIKETSYVFTKGNMTTEFTTPVTETTTQTYSLNVTRNIFTTSTATFNLADTERTITKTAHTNYDEYSTSFQLSFIDSLSEEQEGVWNITTTGTNIYTGQQNFTQRINSMNISNCSGSITDETFEYVLREEQYASVVMGNITTSLKVWAEDEANSRVYTFTWRDVNVTPVCIYTNDSLNIIHTIDYVSNGFDSTNRIIFDSINKTKESISLYSALITSSFITNLIDRTSNALVSHYIEFYKYSNFIAGYVLLESGLTDYAGNLLFGYEPAGKYRFKVYNTTLDEIYDTGSAGTYIVADPTIIRISSDINFSDTETDIYVPTDNSSWVNYTANNASIDVFSKEFRDDINPFYRFLLAIIIALVLGATFFPFLGTLGATAIAYGVFTSFAIITWISWIFPIILALLIFSGYIVLGGNEGT